MKRFEGKTALITGASKQTGIGHAIAMRFAGEGANVIVGDLCKDLDQEYPGYIKTGSNEDLEALGKKIEAQGVRALPHPLDVTDMESVKKLAASVEKEFGGLDILVNNAGGSPGPNTIKAIEERAWLKTIDINLNGIFRMTQAFAPLIAKGGSIVNVSSRAGKVPSVFTSAYCAAKAGSIMLSKVSALELAADGIRVNAICPGQINTELGAWGWKMRAFAYGQTFDEYMEDMKKEIPVGRPGTPEDCANVVSWLCSEEAGFITGQAINVTGGQLMEL